MSNTANFDISSAIGNTPLVKLKNVVPPGCADIYVKLEYFNPTGSYKDRMALAIIDEAEKRGDLKPGMTVIECTGGSTGTSLAFICAAKGYAFKAVSSDVFAHEKLQSMRLFGADLELVISEDGKINANLIPSMIARVKEINEQGSCYWTQQFENKDARIGYECMAHEILAQLNQQPIAAFCGAVGTAGMFSGVAPALKAAQPGIKTVALEPASSPFLTQGVKGAHKVEGIGIGFFPPLLQGLVYDEAMAVDEGQARDMARLLAKKEGIFTGISSGLNITAAIEIARKIGPGHKVVTIAVDSGMKYLAGGLFDA